MMHVRARFMDAISGGGLSGIAVSPRHLIEACCMEDNDANQDLCEPAGQEPQEVYELLRDARLWLQWAIHWRDRGLHGDRQDIYAMLLTEAKFKDFTRKPVADATKVTEVLTALSVESRARVDALVDTALKAGATEAGEAMDYGFMYGRSFNDLDGHIWEIIYMDPGHVQKS
jgi:hypothetical protein